MTTTVQDIFKEMKANLLFVRPDLVLNPGSSVNDIFLGPTSSIIFDNRILLEYNQSLHTFLDILDLLVDEDFLTEIARVENKTVDQVEEDIAIFINKLGANYGLTRHSAVFASRFALFGRFDPPQFNITVSSGTEIQTSDGKVYTTTETVVMDISAAGSPGIYYDSDLNLYVIQAPIQAKESGTVGNATAGSINTLNNQITGIQFVTNKNDITNGIDAESNEEFIDRIKTRLTGTNFATKDGIRNLIIDNFPTVKDVYVADANDALLIRDEGYGGKIDIYVLEESGAIIAQDNIIQWDVKHGGVNDGAYLLQQPVSEVTTVGANFVKDTSSAFVGSNFEKSYVYFALATTLPQIVDYKYYEIAQDIWDFLNQDAYKIIGSVDGSQNTNDVTILIKKAIQADLNMTFTMTVLTGFTRAIVETNVSNAIGDYLNTLLLGETVNSSDIIAEIEGVDGVDSIVFSVFDLDGVGLETTVDPGTVGYVRLGALSIL